MRGRGGMGRYWILMLFIGVLALICAIRMFDLQIVKGTEYRAQAELRLVQAYPLKAPRGEIVDRNGIPFVENRMGYIVQMQKIDETTDALHERILRTANVILAQDVALASEFPIFYDDVNEFWGFTFTESKESREEIKKAQEEELIDTDAANKLKEEQKKQLQTWLETEELTEYENAEAMMNYYRSRYNLSSHYNHRDAAIIVAVRYDMEKNGFGGNNPYVIARDVGELVLQQLKEQKQNFPGIVVEIESIRSYAYPKVASHVLGRTGKIYAEEYEELKDQGYGMNDIVGKDGLEKLLEPYLKGTDGYKSVSMTKSGSETEILQSQPVQPGNYAKLTMDLELQKAMEEALEENITRAVDRNGAGGAIALNPSTGEVLALASYPSYDAETFTEDYNKLVQAKSQPLFNKVLNGTYSPGSTFKPLTAIAALETGVIEPNTYIVDKGKYTYFPSYQPTCLVYSSKGETHGTIEVSEAIGVSCNYFFFEIGRLTGIETMNEYAKKFGLGEKTGIELSESTGLVASPEYRASIHQEWYPGDVIQAAIGQSDNQFTPIQLASYVSTILNKGRRFKVHLLSEIVDYNTHETVKRYNPEVLSDNPISEVTFQKVKDGMRQVVADGTAKAAFEGATYQAAGKTGTAEVPDGADNVLFVGFAPYENPEIVVAVVIEHGASSVYAANVARQVFDAYMEIKAEREGTL